MFLSDGNLDTRLWRVRAGDHYRTLYYNDKNETEHEVKKIIPHPNFGERLMPHDTKGKIFNAKYDIGKTSLSLTFPPGLSHEVTLLTFIKNCCLPLYSNIRNHHGFEWWLIYNILIRYIAVIYSLKLKSINLERLSYYTAIENVCWFENLTFNTKVDKEVPWETNRL